MGVVFYAIVFVGSILMLIWLARGPFFVPTKRVYIPHIISLLALRPGARVISNSFPFPNWQPVAAHK